MAPGRMPSPPSAEILSKMRNGAHTPESMGVLVIENLLQQATSIGKISADQSTIEIPMNATIKLVKSKGIRSKRTVITCIEIGSFSICITRNQT